MKNHFESEYEFQSSIKKAREELVEEKGAACFKTVGFASCVENLTEKEALAIAARTGTSVTHYPRKPCTEVECE